MRKTILVIGAVIGLATAITSSVQAEMPEHEVMVVTEAKSVMTPDIPINAPDIERVAYAVGYQPSMYASHVELTLLTSESTKLAYVSYKNLQAPGDYRLTHEVGWRF